MSKKLKNLLDNWAMDLLDLRIVLDSNEVCDYPLHQKVEEISKKCIGFKMGDLRKVQNELALRKAELLSEILQNVDNDIQRDEEFQTEKDILDIKLQLLSQIIYEKQQYQRRFTHPVERNYVEHAVWGAIPPKEKTMETLRTKEGFIQYEKNGFRKLYYRNENGNLLSTFDSKVFIGLFKMWFIKGKNKIFTFNFKELLHDIHSDTTGGNIAILTKSLENLAATSIIMHEYMDPKSKRRTKTDIHNPIQNARIDPINQTATIHFNDILHESLAAGNIVAINMSLYNDLSPTTKILYLNIINGIPDNITFVEFDALIQHLGLHANTKTKAVKIVVQSFEELKDFGIIDSFEVLKKGRFYYGVKYKVVEWLLAYYRTVAISDYEFLGNYSVQESLLLDTYNDSYPEVAVSSED